MKKYKNLVPIVLIALMVLSTYSLISNVAKDRKEFKLYLERARGFAKQGIVVDALASYGNALEVKEDFDVYLEVCDMFVENNQLNEGIIWAEEMVDKYPEEAKGYEKLLELYLEQEDYNSCFSLKEDIDGHSISTKEIKNIFDKIEYMHEIGYKAYDEVSVFSEGLCAVNKKGSWGFCNERGALQVAAVFDEVGAFGSGYAAVTDEDGDSYYIDAEGNRKLVLPKEMKAKKLGLVIAETIPINSKGKFGYYDVTFEHKFGKYDYASTLNYGIGAVREGGDWYLVDEKGKKINSKSFKDVILDEKEIAYRNDRAFVNNGKGYILVDGKGKQVGKQVFEDAKVFLSDSYASVKIDGKWGFVNKDGKVVIDAVYDDARSFSNGLASLYVKMRNGVILMKIIRLLLK